MATCCCPSMKSTTATGGTPRCISKLFLFCVIWGIFLLMAVQFRNIRLDGMTAPHLNSRLLLQKHLDPLTRYGGSVSDINVKLGSLKWTPESGVEEYSVSKIDPHPNYPKAVDNLQSEERDVVFHPNNIAIITLSKSVTLSDKVQTIELASMPVQIQAGVMLCGWGSDFSAISSTLNYASLSIMNIATCVEIAGGAPSDHDTNICTAAFDPISGHAAGACIWDHGAPLVQYNAPPAFTTVLHGIVSYANCGSTVDNVTPSIYSSVYAHRAFIDSVMNSS